jgi:hypothetical protein
MLNVQKLQLSLSMRCLLCQPSVESRVGKPSPFRGRKSQHDRLVPMILWEQLIEVYSKLARSFVSIGVLYTNVFNELTLS